MIFKNKKTKKKERERGTNTQQRFRAGVRRMSSSQRQKLSEALRQDESLQYEPKRKKQKHNIF